MGLSVYKQFFQECPWFILTKTLATSHLDLDPDLNLKSNCNCVLSI